MAKSRQAEFNDAVLKYILRCIDEEDPRELQTTLELPPELTRELVQELPNLRLGELRRFSETRALLARPKINAQALDQLLRIIRDERKTEHDMLALLKADASQEMLFSLFHVDRSEYARLRQLHGVRSTGRTPTATAEQEKRLLDAMGDMTTDELLATRDAETWLRLCEETGMQLRTLWRLIQQWSVRP